MASASEITNFLKTLVEKNAEEKSISWLDQKVGQVQSSGTNSAFFLAFSQASRFFKKDALELSEEEAIQANSLVEGFEPAYWSVLQAARTILLLSYPQEKEGWFAVVNQLFETADMNEQQALFAALPVLPYPEELLPRAIDGCRTNMTLVFDAIALNNPYPANYFPDANWNQLVLKAVFMQRPLYQIQSLDARRNPALADIASDFAHERWAAGRSVMPELWRLVVPFINDRFFADLKKVVESEDEMAVEAGLLALYQCDSEKAKQLLKSRCEEVMAIEYGEITWEKNRSRISGEKDLIFDRTLKYGTLALFLLNLKIHTTCKMEMYIDPHIHLVSRTTDDYEAMRKAGIVATIEPAFWLGQPRTEVGSFKDYFSTLVGWERFRASQFGIVHYCTMGLNSKEANNVALAEQVMELLPLYAGKEGVVAIGEIGYDDQTEAEDRFYRLQLELAKEVNLPVLIHTPHRDKRKGTIRSMDVAEEHGMDPGWVVVDHNNEETVKEVLDRGFWAGFTIYPHTKMGSDRMVEIVKQYGPERIIVNSAADWGISDPLAVPKTANLMRKMGIPEEHVRLTTYQNALRVFGLSGQMNESDWLNAPSIDQTKKLGGNSVLRGGQVPRVEGPADRVEN